jgi:hypothetical protein
VDFVIVGEAFDFVEFVVEDSFVEVSGYADVEGAGEASENVGAIVAVVVNPGHGGYRGSSTWFFLASEEERGAQNDKISRKSRKGDVTDVTGIMFVA